MLPATRPWLILWIEHITKSERAVIERKATSGTVVAIKITLTVTNSDPVRYQ